MKRLLRGARWRLGTTLTTFVVVTIAVGTAFWAPTFASAAADSLARQRINDRPATGVGLSWVSSAGAPGTAGLAAAVDQVAALTGDSRGTLARPTIGLVATANPPGLDTRRGGVPLVWREDQCAHIVLTGRCPSGPGEVLVPRGLPTSRGWATGRALSLRSPMFDPQDTASAAAQRPVRVRIVGTWAAKEPGSDYWFDATRYRADSSLSTRPDCAERPDSPRFARNVAPFLASRSTFDQLASVSVLGDSRPARDLDHATIHTAVAATRRAVAADSVVTKTPTVSAGCPSLVATGRLDAVVRSLDREQDRLDGVASVVAASLGLLGLSAVCLVVAAAAAQRRAEVAVAKLRGMRHWRLWRFSVAESLVGVLAAVAAGFATGYGASVTTVSSWLAPGTDVTPTAHSLTFAGVVGVASLLTVAAMSAVVNRGPAAQLLSAAGRRRATSASALAVQVVVVGAAAGLLLQVRPGASGRGTWLALSCPSVLGLASAVVVVWVIGVVAVLWTSATSLRGGDAAFIAARRARRRQDTAALVAPFVAAAVVTMVAAGASRAATGWREDTAAVRNGAALQIASSSNAFATLLATRAADPRGRWLMAVEVSGDASNGLDRRGFADLSRWDRVAAPVMGPVTGAESARIGRTFSADTWDPASFAGRKVVLQAGLHPRTVKGAVQLRLDLLDRTGRTHLVPLAASSGRHRATVPFCSSGCVLRRIVLGATSDRDLVGTATVVVESLAVDGKPSTIRFDPDGWRPAQQPGNDPKRPSVTGLAAARSGLTFTAAATPTHEIPAITPASTPRVRNVVMSSGLALARIDGSAGAGNTGAKGVDGALVPARAVATPENLLLLGPVGVLGNLPDFVMESGSEQLLARVYVLARSDTPAAVMAALAREDIDVSRPRRIGSLEAALRRDGYAQGLRMLTMLAAGALALAVALTAGMLLDQRRRRGHEAATLRVVGVRPAVIGRSLVLELGVAVLTAVLVVVATSALSLWRVLPALPLVARTTFDPRVDSSVPWPALVVAALAAGAVAFSACVVLLRQVVARGRPGTLRDDGG